MKYKAKYWEGGMMSGWITTVTMGYFEDDDIFITINGDLILHNLFRACWRKYLETGFEEGEKDGE